MQSLYYNSWLQLTCVFLLAAALVVSGCDGGGSNEEETGTVEGQITAADGTTPIPGATVGLASSSSSNTSAKSKASARPLNTVLSLDATIQTDGPTTTTDSEGYFSLDDVPAGKQELTAKRGVFEVTFEVDVEPGTTTETETAELESTKKLGVVPGFYDSIEEILVDLGNEVDTLSVDDLSDASTLSEYSFVFINCGSGSDYPDERIDALKEYMENGGTVYASDQEEAYAKALFSDDISFSRNASSQEIEATIVSDDLEQFVGKSEVDIQYDLGSWARIVDLSEDIADTPGAVLLEGQPEEVEEGTEPLAIKLDVGEGRLVHTTFHNEAGVTEDQEVVLRYFIYLPSS